MRRYSLLFACVLAIIALLGCGGENDADPTSRITLTVSPADGVEPGGNAIITATVARPGGTATTTTGSSTTTTEGTTTTTTDKKGWGETVTFRLLTSNGARLSARARPAVRDSSFDGDRTWASYLHTREDGQGRT